MRKPKVSKKYMFPSSSAPGVAYTVFQYDDGSTSCDCPGWINKKKDKPRGCKHTAGVAVMSNVALDNVALPAMAFPPSPQGGYSTVPPKKLAQTTLAFNRRKIRFEDQ
jgi:hypothetical protein